MSEGDVSNGGRISVSRDALRAELAEFKLQLISELRQDLDRKATRGSVEALETRVAALERSTFDSRAVSVHNDAMFTKREKVGSALIGVAILALTVFQVWHGA